MNSFSVTANAPQRRAPKSSPPGLSTPATLKRLLPFLCAASTFGPCLAGPLRLDHLVVYALALFAAPTALNFAMTQAPPLLLLVGLLLLANAAWCFVSTLVQSALTPDMLSAIDNFIQPLAVLMTGFYLAQHASRPFLERLLSTLCVAFTAGLALNALLALAMSQGHLLWLEHYYIRSITPTGESVWRNAMLTGRFPGIFDQPFEAGFAYSLGLLALLYLRMQGRLSLPLLAVGIVLLLIGGFLSGSKAFLFGGIPLSLLSAFLSARSLKQRMLATLASCCIVLTLVVFGTLGPDDSYVKRSLLQILSSQPSRPVELLEQLTAGRLAGPAVNIALARQVLEAAPLHGFGYAPPSVALDNGYLEFLYRGGLVSLLIYLIINLAFLLFFWRARRYSQTLATWFFIVMVLLAGSALGGPTLTMNRVSVILWLLLVLGVCLLQPGVLRSNALPTYRPAGRPPTIHTHRH